MMENVCNVQELDPIRQYCPARLEEEQFELIKWEHHDPISHHIVDAILHEGSWDDHPLLAEGSDRHELEEIVDTFFNADCFDEDNRNLMQLLQAPDQDPCSHGMYNYFSVMPADAFEGSVKADDIRPVDHDDEVDLSEVLMRSEFSSDDHHSLQSIEEFSHGSLVDHDRGIQIVHLLLGCAEAVGCKDTQLVDTILTKISPLVSPFGDSLQRVSYYFAMGLRSRLLLIQNQISGNATSSSASLMMMCGEDDKKKMEAIHLLNQTTPYLSFGFRAANDAISQVAKGKDFLHILDLGSGHHHLQWPSLIRNLASRPEGPPKLVRITTIIKDQEALGDELHQRAQAIVDEASSLSIPIQFHYMTRPLTPSLLSKENLDLREGEELIVNSIMHLHKFMKESGGSLKEILQAIKRLGPTLLTVVEQDANHNGAFFLGRFLESLHYYSAIFDSLEASLPRDSAQRMKIETFHYAKEIQNIVASEGLDRTERHLSMEQWRRHLGGAGFQVVGFESTSQARMMLSVYGCDGYTLAIDKGCLLLGWIGRSIMLASAWKVAH